MADKMDDLMAELDIEGLDEVDDISSEKAKSIVEKFDVLKGTNNDEGVKQTKEEVQESKKDIDVSDIDMKDVDALLEKAFTEDDDIDIDMVNKVMDAALESVEEEMNTVEDKDDDVADEEYEKKPAFKDKIKNISDKLFTNIPDEEYDKKIYANEEKTLEKKEEQKEKKAKLAEEKKAEAEQIKKQKAEEKAKKKEQADARKKKDAAAKKAKAAKRKEEKKAAEEEEALREPIGRLNKLGVVVVFSFVGVLTLAAVLFAMSLRNNVDYEEEAEILMHNGNYEMAYIKLLSDPDLDTESELYNKIKIVQSLNRQLSYYESFAIAGDREKALDALIVAVRKYDEEKNKAKKYSVKNEYASVYAQVISKLKEDFEITAKEAREIDEIKNNEEYSEKIALVCKESQK